MNISTKRCKGQCGLGGHEKQRIQSLQFSTQTPCRKLSTCSPFHRSSQSKNSLSIHPKTNESDKLLKAQTQKQQSLYQKQKGNKLNQQKPTQQITPSKAFINNNDFQSLKQKILQQQLKLKKEKQKHLNYEQENKENIHDLSTIRLITNQSQFSINQSLFQSKNNIKTQCDQFQVNHSNRRLNTETQILKPSKLRNLQSFIKIAVNKKCFPVDFFKNSNFQIHHKEK